MDVSEGVGKMGVVESLHLAVGGCAVARPRSSIAVVRPRLVLSLHPLLSILRPPTLVSSSAMQLTSLLRLPTSLLVASLALAIAALPVSSDEVQLLVLTPEDFDQTVANGVWYVASHFR